MSTVVTESPSRASLSPGISFTAFTPQKLDELSFPHKPKGRALPATLENLQYLLSLHRVVVRYDVIGKQLLVNVPGLSGPSENFTDSGYAHIVSLCNLNGLATAPLDTFLAATGDQNPYNPAAEWILSVPWDGKDRLAELSATLTVREEFPRHMKELVLRKWLSSCVAAALHQGTFRCRGVLTLQGPQGIGKTAWIRRLVPDSGLSQRLIKLDHCLDTANKDSVTTAISSWIVELGELESTFKKDVARLKSFLTTDQDRVRRPYAKKDSFYPRQTVFCASVNDASFLVDHTGNTRFWPLPCTAIDFRHSINMQQVFAQLQQELKNARPDEALWWLTNEEQADLENLNQSYRIVSVIHERVMQWLDLDAPASKRKRYTASEVLLHIGISNPTNTQAKECGAVLRELVGEPSLTNGSNKWRVALRESRDRSASFSPLMDDDDDSGY